MPSEACEQRQFLAAHEHVDRVDLDEADAIEDTAEVTPVDASRGTRVAETLRVERDATRLAEGDSCP